MSCALVVRHKLSQLAFVTSIQKPSLGVSLITVNRLHDVDDGLAVLVAQPRLWFPLQHLKCVLNHDRAEYLRIAVTRVGHQPDFVYRKLYRCEVLLAPLVHKEWVQEK